VLSEAQNALHVDFVEADIFQFDPSKRNVLAHLVALALIGLGIDLFLVQKGFVEQPLAAFEFLESALKVHTQIPRKRTALFPNVEYHGTEQAHELGSWLEGFEQIDEARF
jgi:hypothetical protein